MTRARRARRGAAVGEAAFTLLEVLVAVAILGILYAVLAEAGMRGLMAEGEADRRLRASLLADQLVDEVEQKLSFGEAPALGRTEGAAGPFRSEVEVTPLSLALPPPREEAGSGAAAGTPPAPAVSVLGATDAEGRPALLRVAVEVRWPEGVVERRVRRVRYAFDPRVIADELEAVDFGGNGADAQEDIDSPEAGR